jgi:hypothetical protein
MDLVSLTKRINQSRLLTEAERTYWRSNVERMTPEQIEKLEAILGEAEQLVWNPSMQSFLNMTTKTSTAPISA